MQHALRAISIDSAIGNRGCCARAFIEAEVVPILCWISKTPNRISAFRIQALDRFFICYPVKENQFARHNGGPAKALADILLPDDGRAFLRPVGGNVVAGINPVSGRAEELRPVAGEQSARDEEGE